MSIAVAIPLDWLREAFYERCSPFFRSSRSLWWADEWPQVEKPAKTKERKGYSQQCGR
jgi:hypothetical protein